MARKQGLSGSSGYTILVVDDQDETLVSSKFLLERDGHRVLVANNGAAALGIFRGEQIDLVILDFFMPRINGQQLVEAIRELDRDVQIVLQTGFSGDKPPREMMRSLDIQGYHDKTDGPDRLLVWVEAALKSSNQLRKVREAERELLASEAQLRQLSIRLLTLQEEERERISRELHDEVGQLLTAVDLDLDWSIRRCPADLDSLSARLGETKGLVRDALDATRELCASLRTHELERRALAWSVRYYAEEFGRRTGIQVQVTAICDDELLGPEAARNVYRIFQEALSNVARHARATSVSVSLRPAAAGLVLSVIDDGAGFETGRVSDPLAIGLIGMRERARLIGGSLNVDSSPGKGTSITLAIPLCIAPQ